jgi:hypothetical protein
VQQPVAQRLGFAAGQLPGDQLLTDDHKLANVSALPVPMLRLGSLS